MMNLRPPTGLASVIILSAAANLTVSAPVNAQELTRIVNIGALLAPKNPQGVANSKSIIAPITKPLGDSLAPLVDAIDIALDPLTDPIDAQLGTPLLGALAPLTDPLLGALVPVTDPIDGIVADLTGGSVSDALTNIDKNTTDGDGIVNDLLGGPKVPGSGTEAGELSPLGSISASLGATLEPLINALDLGLDPLTDVVDDQLLEPILDALAPGLDPLLDAIEPVTDPVDGLVADLTGGSLEDALTNIDDNTADGNGVVNDLLGGESANNDSGTEAGEASILAPITGPLGDSLDNLVSAADMALDPVTDAIDDNVGEPLLDALTPITEPLLANLEPVTDPVDGLLEDITGGSVEDALTNNDDNTSDGDGIVNDLLGGSNTSTAGDGSETSPLNTITASLGDGISDLIDTIDTGLDPLTDVIDDQVLEPVLDQLAPVTDPILAALEPVTNPVDGIVEDLTGGSLEDALTNDDDNAADGNGLVNDLLGGGNANSASGTEAGESSALEPITGPLGESIDSLVSALDTALDPVTDAIDDQVGEPLLDALSPVVDPLLDAVEPVTDPVDGIVADLTGGSVEDALTNNDDNTSDGDGIVNDLLGGSDGNGGETSPLEPVTELVGDAIAPIIDSLDQGLDPATSVVDNELGETLLDALSPVTEPILDIIDPITNPLDGAVADLTGGSLEDALTNNDTNTSDGNGIVNDALGGGGNSNGGLAGGLGNGPFDQPALLALLDRDSMDTNPNSDNSCTDLDIDGVCDEQDECLDTPIGSAVLANGCHLSDAAPLRLNGVFFETNSAILTINATTILDKAVAVIQQSDAEKIEVSGHTDAIGSDNYNLTLSQNRAQSVKRYLTDHGVNGERLVAQGYGEAKPLANNDTTAGRAENRRVELTIINTK
ncbi:OmpA family protein [Zhongshania aliphaticivorans]|uniref:OmpA family protein n=1 Tax=Zhongshania aliphaticivorans TaxID=1470434 RepID=UPI0012E4F49C|nr:OmpA family protein [Zhongshania aliphaticivorans]CAA0093072.1 Outer membrane porin F [Zhongshania aliphaticivorans]